MEVGVCIYKCSKCGKRIHVNIGCYDFCKAVSVQKDYTPYYGLHQCHENDSECGFLIPYSFIPNDDNKNLELMAKDIKGEIVIDYIKINHNTEEKENTNDNK